MTPRFLALGVSWGSEVSTEGWRGELLEGPAGSGERKGVGN